MISLHEGKGAPVKKPPERGYSLELALVGVTPRIWRRMLVRETMWLSRLHDAIQISFDWFDYQAHVFAFEELRFGNPAKTGEGLVEDDRDVVLADLDLEHRARFTYLYAFGEGWKLDVKIEQPIGLEKGTTYPRCIAGARAGPPEDCGGAEAFHDLLACIQEPDTDLGREWREWLGPEYDPDRCDLARINKDLKKLARQ